MANQAVPGTAVPSGALLSPGGFMGAQGATGQTGPTGVSADAGNIAQLGSDSLVMVPQSTLWNMRLRSYNAIGNPNFEVDQRNFSTVYVNPTGGIFAQDRWRVGKTGTMTINTQQLATGSGAVIPGTNYRISANLLAITLTAQETSLAAGDFLMLYQVIEGPMARALANDVSSVSLLVATNATLPLKFGLSIRDSTSTYSLVKLCTISSGSSGNWNLIQLPNLPTFPSGGAFNVTPGSSGYSIAITLAAGSTYNTPANDIWQSGNFLGAIGQDNFAARPTSTNLQILFVQHEPGPLCTQFIDKPFDQNYNECLRYYTKNVAYGVNPASSNTSGIVTMSSQSGTASATIWGSIMYPRPMAKNPTITIYNWNTGAAGQVYCSDGTARGVSSVNNVGMTGFDSMTLGSTAPLGTLQQFNYIADTSM